MVTNEMLNQNLMKYLEESKRFSLLLKKAKRQVILRKAFKIALIFILWLSIVFLIKWSISL